MVVDSTCPCWTEEELAAIEGFIPGRDDGFLDCNYQTDMNTGIVFLASAAEVIPPQQLSIFAVAVNSEQFQRCDYRNNQVTDPRRFRDVSPGQAAVCLQQVIDHCASLGQGQ